MKTIVDIIRDKARSQGNQPVYFSGPPDFSHTHSYSDIVTLSERLAFGLRSMGVTHQVRVGILADSSPEWEFSQFAVFLCGGVVVGLDVNDSVDAYRRIITTCEIEIVLVSDPRHIPKIDAAVTQGEKIKFVAIGSQSFSDSRVVHWSNLPFRHGESWQDPPPSADDIATLFFTSGTTGDSKGIEYRHGQLVYSAETILNTFPEIKPRLRTLCWLPLSNWYQRLINFCALIIGAEIYFIEKPTDVSQHLGRTSPDIFVSVPRFYEKVHEGMRNTIAGSSLPTRLVFHCGVWVGRTCSKISGAHAVPLGWHLLSRIFEALLFKKLRLFFGTRIQFTISGSAPLSKDLLEFFHSIGLLILEAYGTSENAVPVSCNTCSDFRFGSVGKPLLKDSVLIADDGEILVKGYGVFSGYYKDPRRDCFENGYYKTGDLGYFDRDGYLFLTGRKSNVFKTSTGVKVPTQLLQDTLRKSSYVDLAVTLGENRKTPVVLVTLNYEGLSVRTGLPVGEIWDPKGGCLSAEALTLLRTDFHKHISEIPQKFRPAGVVILARQLSIDEKEITPNLKIRRQYIEKKFSTILDDLYSDLDEKRGGLPIWVIASDNTGRKTPG